MHRMIQPVHPVAMIAAPAVWKSRAGNGILRKAMINLLASLFRGLSFIFGISAPPPEQDQRSFVFMWLGIIAFLLAFATGLLYAISHMHLL